jgi:hypothetical protein
VIRRQYFGCAAVARSRWRPASGYQRLSAAGFGPA